MPCPNLFGFNPRVPRRTRQTRQRYKIRIRAVSILASREGRDYYHCQSLRGDRCFNPRVPRRTRPSRVYKAYKAYKVSILASREGRDHVRPVGSRCVARFNPRVPRRTRLDTLPLRSWEAMFQSSRPAKDATATRDAQIPRKYVSILASREGRDWTRCPSARGRQCFNPRVP